MYTNANCVLYFLQFAVIQNVIALCSVPHRGCLQILPLLERAKGKHRRHSLPGRALMSYEAGRRAPGLSPGPTGIYSAVCSALGWVVGAPDRISSMVCRLSLSTHCTISRQSTISKDNPMNKIIAGLVASAFLIGGAYAQTPVPPAGAPRAPGDSTPAAGKSEAQRNTDVEKHIVDLHAKLKITSAEEAKWDDVAKAMRENANEIEQAIDKREAHGTAIDDLNAYGEVVQAHADGIKKLAKVFAPLYTSMSDDQKKVADEVFVHHAHDGKKVASQ
jgi:protein CpxP